LRGFRAKRKSWSLIQMRLARKRVRCGSAAKNAPVERFKLLTNSPYHPIVPGDMRAGNVFLPSVRTLVGETIP